MFLLDSESNDGDEKHSNAAQKVGDRKSSDEIWGLFVIELLRLSNLDSVNAMYLNLDYVY